jgi:hypothetical protein
LREVDNLNSQPSCTLRSIPENSAKPCEGEPAEQR